MLAAWAESTSRAEIGALAACNSYRNPELPADMARTAGGRLDDLATALPRIESRWAKLNPKPTRDIPVLIGGGGGGGEKKTLKLTAKHANIWHSFSPAAPPPTSPNCASSSPGATG